MRFREFDMRVRPITAALAVAATLTVSACAPPTLDEPTRDGLRRHVVTVAEASAAADWPAAVASLDAMATELAAARDKGLISAERFEMIVLAMELVRQDLDAAIAAAADDAERVRLIEEQARLLEQIEQLRDAPVGVADQDDPNGSERDGSGASDGAGTNGDDGRGDGVGKGDKAGGNGKNGENGKDDRNGK